MSTKEQLAQLRAITATILDAVAEVIVEPIILAIKENKVADKKISAADLVTCGLTANKITSGSISANSIAKGVTITTANGTAGTPIHGMSAFANLTADTQTTKRDELRMKLWSSAYLFDPINAYAANAAANAALRSFDAAFPAPAQSPTTPSPTENESK